MKPSSVLFDFGETLLHATKFDMIEGSRFLFRIARNPNTVPFDEYQEYTRYLNPIIEERRNASLLEHSWQCFNAILNRRFSFSFPGDRDIELEFWETAIWHEPAPGLMEMLDFLKESDIPLGVVSNTAFSGRIIEHELSKHGILGYFRFVLSSADLGIRKPDPEIFHTASSMLRMRNEDVMFIGDRLKNDYEGSRTAGMVPLLYSGLYHDDAPAECRRILSWNQFIPLFNGL